jgi:hypothetical protein
LDGLRAFCLQTSRLGLLPASCQLIIELSDHIVDRSSHTGTDHSNELP